MIEFLYLNYMFSYKQPVSNQLMQARTNKQEQLMRYLELL